MSAIITYKFEIDNENKNLSTIFYHIMAAHLLEASTKKRTSFREK